MKLVQKYPLLGSSANPTEVSLTVKGALLALVPVIIMALTTAGITIEPDTLVELINTLFAVISGLSILFGLVRKIYIAVKYR